MSRPRAVSWALVPIVLLAGTAAALAHSGPPYPVVSNQTAGAYRVSVWTDPDATDDRMPAGQFWVVIEGTRGGSVPAGTRVNVAIRARDRDQPFAEAVAKPVDGDVTRQFANLLMDHEGPFDVRVVLDGPWGGATIDTQVQATYDLRPPLPLIAVYVLPFLAVGFLWGARLVRRRRAHKTGLGLLSHKSYALSRSSAAASRRQICQSSSRFAPSDS